MIMFRRRPAPYAPRRLPLPALPGLVLPRLRLPGIPLPGLLLLGLLLASCGSGTATPGLADGDVLLDLEVEDLYRVGSREGGTWDAFTRITSMAFGDDGRLHILDPQQRRVHVVGESGEHLLSFGVQGDGPGELRNAVGVQVLADGRIVVADNGHQAFLVFGPDGSFQRSQRYDADGSLPGSRLQRFGADAVLSHAQGFRFEGTPGGGPPTPPTTTPVYRWSLDASHDGGARERVLDAWRPEREPPRSQGGGGGMAMMVSISRALEPGVHFAALPDGRLALADSSAYQIRIYSAEGQSGPPPQVVGREIRPVPVGPEEQAGEKARRLAELEAGGGPQIQMVTQGPGGGGAQVVPQEQIREMLRSQMEEMSFWHEIPVVTRLAADPDGRLWVERSAGIGEEGPIDLLTADGDYLGTLPAGGIRTPMAFGPGGLAAWVELDELEVPFVRVARLRVE